MRPPRSAIVAHRTYRNTRLYRPLGRLLRVYNKRIIRGLHARGFIDFSPAFPALLSNLDLEGTRIGVLARRAGVTRQAAGQMLREIERCGYVDRRRGVDDARATVVRFTARGRRLMSAVFELVDAMDAEFTAALPRGEFERLRTTIVRLADTVDPIGTFGPSDEPTRTRDVTSKRLPPTARRNR
jgi:DNA-binding MarR family transcriptional regulator